jgi:hypothetical protein
MAVACAAAELLMRRELEVDLVMCVEGEEENGSGGFGEAVRNHKVGFLWRWAGKMLKDDRRTSLGMWTPSLLGASLSDMCSFIDETDL